MTSTTDTGIDLDLDSDALTEEILVSVVHNMAAERQLIEHAEEVDHLLERASAGNGYLNRQALGDALSLVIHANRRAVTSQ